MAQHVIRVCVLVLAMVSCSKAAAPVVSGLPDIVYIGEQETGTRFLYWYFIQDPNGNAFTCANVITATKAGAAVTPTGNEFNLRKNTATGFYELYAVASGTCCTFATATADKYINTITCTDSNGEVSTAVALTVDVVAGEKVTINNLEGTNNAATVSALGTVANTLIKTVDTTSVLGHTLRYNMTSTVDSKYFKIDSSTGAITTDFEMKYLDSSTPVVYLTVTAYDTTDQIKVNSTLTVNMNTQNTIPILVNFPPNDTKVETLAAGTVLMTVTPSDPDTGQTHTYTYDCTPTAGNDTFEMDANGNFKIATGKSLNFEKIPFFNCSFYVSDSIHTQGPYNYQLTVTDSNEAPSFSDTMYFVTAAEAAKGALTFTPGFTCTDPDTGDTTTYDFQNVNNSDRFVVHSDGSMTYNTDYDVDQSAMPTSVVLTVYCIDSGGVNGIKLTGTSQVTITITDVNDNEPTFPSTTYSMTVTQLTSPGTAIGSIVPSDKDSGTNAALTCSGSSTSTYSSYYSVGNDCQVYLTKTIDFAYGTHVGYNALATDDGTPQLTGTTAIDIIYQEAATTSTTTTAATTTPYNFWDHGENIAMFVMLLLAGLALLGLLTWCLLRLCCGGGSCGSMGRCDCCRGGNRRRYPPQKRQVTPDTPPRRRARTPSPSYREKTPPRIVEPQRPLQVVRTMGRPPGYWRALAPPGYSTAPPNVPGFYR